MSFRITTLCMYQEDEISLPFTPSKQCVCCDDWGNSAEVGL